MAHPQSYQQMNMAAGGAAYGDAAYAGGAYGGAYGGPGAAGGAYGGAMAAPYAANGGAAPGAPGGPYGAPAGTNIASGAAGGPYGAPGYGAPGAGAGYGGMPPPPADAVVYSAGGPPAFCVSAGCAVGGDATMSAVGPGNGDYVTETTYRYVGQGAGDHSIEQPRAVNWGRVCCLLLVILAVTSAAAAALAGTPTTTPELSQASLEDGPPIGLDEISCTFWGDPHVKTFDGARPSFYGDGEYYIVKSEEVSIQGRYMGTKYTAGLAATNKIVVGGKFLKGHTIEVGSLEDGPVRINGVPALTQFPSSEDLADLGEITYSAEGELVDEATAAWPKKVVKMELPEGVNIEVFRWTNYIDLRIQMAKQEGQDGACGNMNSDASDDTTEAIFNRIGARVPEGELLFSHRTKEELTEVEEKLLTMCDPDNLGKAQKECGADLSSWEASPTPMETKSCMLDICYGSNEHTLKMAKGLGLVPPGSPAAETE